jgi:recombinase
VTARPAANSAAMAMRIADQLRAWGVRGVLVQMAERRQIIELRCEMPQCYCHKGRKYFELKTTPLSKWAPTPDHYPILKSAGGQLRPDNVRLAHYLCNQRDYLWRTRIKAMLAKGMALEEIAESLNRKKVPTPHGGPRWAASTVRKAFVS